MAIIAPNMLHLDASVPHSLDNQFLPDQILRSMVRHRRDFNSPEVRKQRSRLAKKELMRSLLYAEQVVINRAFFVNTPYLFELYNSHSRAQEFARLMLTGAIIPFVTGKHLLEQSDFDKHPDGAKALELLLGFTRHNQNVSLDGMQGEENSVDPLDALGLHLTSLFAGLEGIDAGHCELLLRQLGAGQGLLSRIGRSLVDEFQMKLQELVKMANQPCNENGKPILYRNSIYKRFFCVTDTEIDNPVANGRFLPRLPTSHALLFLKKLADTVYNFNLSDHLGCSSLTAPGVEGRTLVDLIRKTARVDSPTASKVQAMGTEEEKLLQKAGEINARYLKESVEIPLPNLEKLSVNDVYNIRQDKNGKWRSFIESKHRLMEIQNADNLVDAFDEFVHRHRELHLEMSRNFSWSIPMEGLVSVMHLVEKPYARLISPVAEAMGAPQPLTEAIDIGLEIPAALAFTVHSINEKSPELRSSAAFWGTWKFRATSRKELMLVRKEFDSLEAGARPLDNRQVEQSKS